MGDWYAVETMVHNTAVDPNTISTVVDKCPILQLTRENNNRTIRLNWNEKAGTLGYRFRQPKSKDPGFWESAGHPEGSLAERVKFSGTVLVMKAVSSHMVLTFCSRAEYNTYSVVMSRTRRLPARELTLINSMLVRRGLVQGEVKEMCKGVATSARMCLGVFMLILATKFIFDWP